jgi:hypothetical protein
MCVEGVGNLFMEDENVRALLADPRLDLVHHQVVMTLYSLDAGGRLADYREILPLYLSVDWERCSEILETLETVGLISRRGDDIALTHPIASDAAASQCLCHV